MLSLRQFIDAKGYVGTASFFHVLPDQPSVFVNESSIRAILDSNVNTTSNHFKHQIYSKFYDVIARPKYTGFEQLSALDAQYRSQLESQYGVTDVILEPVPQSYRDSTAASTLEDIRQVCLAAALEIQTRAAGKQIYMCMSGGIDSEFAAYFLKEAGVPFKAFIMNYGGQNEFDISYARNWCIANGIDIVEEQFDIQAFFETELASYAAFSEVSSPQILTYQKMISIVNEEYNGYPVLGGELRFFKSLDGHVYFKYAWDKAEGHDPVSMMEK